MSELDTFIREFRLRPRHAATLFGASPRSLRRWRRRGRWPKHVDHTMEVCTEQRAPINYSLPRGPSIGCNIYEWRERLFGPAWRDWRSDRHPMHYRRRRLPGGPL